MCKHGSEVLLQITGRQLARPNVRFGSLGTLGNICVMSALPPKADRIGFNGVRFLRDWLSLFASVSVRIDFCKFGSE